MVQTKIVFFEENDLVNEYLATEYAREGSPLFENDEMLGRIFEHKVLEDGREVSEITTYGTAKLLELLGFIDPIQS